MTMSEASPTLADRALAEVADLLDLQLSPLGLLAIEALSPLPGQVIVDVGCGAAQTVLQLAEMVGIEGRVIGVDIAPLVLAVARKRAGGLRQVSFIECDVTTLSLPEQSVDGIFSRFGVMAFEEPVAAFSNLHRMMKRRGRIAFVCWRSLAENELDCLPLRAAGLEHLADHTPFSFENPDYVRSTLEQAGFEQVSIRASDVDVSSGDVDAMAFVISRVGALGRILRENPDLLAEAEPRVRAALNRVSDQARVSLRAAIWIVVAEA
jgi:SAM-dependent methyltransferase